MLKNMNKKERIELFIKKAKEIHGDKYDYSKVEYINALTKVCIICPIHGEFWMIPNNHTSKKQGCKKCGTIIVATKLKTNETKFIEKANKLHCDNYDYSKVEYVNAHTKVCIICKKHGEFWQVPNAHLRGQKCPKCCNNLKSNTDDFVEKAKKIHNNFYDYSKVEYINNHTKICIICPIHGEFWQTPQGHLNGKGCSNCNKSRLETRVEIVLCDKNIEFTQQKKFEWLKYNKKGALRLDFYLPKHNIAIECQGEQHFRAVEYFGGEKNFKYRRILDKQKNKLCEKHNIPIYYINYDEDVETKLIEILNQYGNTTNM